MSCYITPKGVFDNSDLLQYVKEGKKLGVHNYIFRYSPVLTDADVPIRKTFAALKANGWVCRYAVEKTDAIIYELYQNGTTVTLSSTSEEPDPDKKVRRLILMPDCVLYTSWIDKTSYLFDDEASKIACSVLKEYPVGNYPSAIWDRTVMPAFIHQSEGHTIDLHVHSSVSDGWLTPTEVLDNAFKAGIQQLVFTEHNCLHDNLKLLSEAARKRGINIPFYGVEFSTVYCREGMPYLKFHLLVYGLRVEQFSFIEGLYNPNETRNQHLRDVYRSLNERGLIRRSLEDIYHIDDPEASTIKKMLVRTPLANEVASVCGITPEEAKERYVPKCPDELRYREYLDTEKMISLAHKNGCVAVLAHPGWIRPYQSGENVSLQDLLTAITSLSRSGLDGIEVVHRLNASEMRDVLFKLATHLDLFVTGGSDYHGKPHCNFGKNGISKSAFNQLLGIINVSNSRNSR